IVTSVKPDFDPELVDRYLATAELMPAESILVLNKIDLINDKTRKLWQEFTRLPYTCIQTTIMDPEHPGIPQLKTHLANRSSVLVGLSGAGKSSILNQIIPGLDIQTQEISAALGEGKHTTTVATSYLLEPDNPESGRVIDSPGVRDFAPPPIPAGEVADGFIEIREKADLCKFRDCQHLREPDCAVKTAVEAGEICARRYKSYRHLRDLMEKLYNHY
ncbi:MAG: ribosome small subunit-dependent GTPase A, partial [Gammaproteobacteria bacterium]|nr:ribosome small subunit-dependent GTPase A [Gammaproteobacteria bacterium]